MTVRVWLLLLLLLSCVPATADLDPSGAAGVTMDPSPATRGEGFVTSDGYTVHLERVVLLSGVYASAPANADGRYDSASTSGAETVLFSASSTEPIWAGGVSVGAAIVSLSAWSVPLGDLDDAVRVQADVADVWPRFAREPEVYGERTNEYGEFDPTGELGGRRGPSFLVVFRAEGHGLSLRADLTLESSFSSYPALASEVRVDVEANALHTAPQSIRAECLFEARAVVASEGPVAPGATTFAPFAAADANADGVLTGSELLAAPSVDAHSGGSLGTELVERTHCLLRGESDQGAPSPDQGFEDAEP